MQGKEDPDGGRRARDPGRGAGMTGSRILLAAFGDAGHAFPAIALARALHDRGHGVAVETWERWREAVEGEGIRFQAAEQYKVFPPPPPGSGAGPAEAATALQPLFDDFQPELVVSDILTAAPALAAELNGCPTATLIPHLYPVHQPAMPFFGFGMMPPRTGLGRSLWKAALPILETGLRQGRKELNTVRDVLGLPSQEHFHGGISERLALVSTYPDLEYPREWPASVKVCGPLSFEIPHPDIDLPAGEDPLILVASSTAHDPECELIRDCFAAFAGRPVRVLATSNGHFPRRPIKAPANGSLVGWLSYTQAMAAADLVVCHGGHGTVCRAIGARKPVLVSPAIGDMAENGVRVQWTGAGLMLPNRLRAPASLRWCAKELLDEPAYAARATEIATASPPGTPETRMCEEIERLLA